MEHLLGWTAVSLYFAAEAIAILSLRRPKPMMVELEGDSPQDEVLNQSASPAASRRQLIVE